MKKLRICYAALIILIVVLGLYSRSTLYKPAFFESYGGDTLWAMMVYFGFAFLLVRHHNKTIGCITVAFCCLIECSQLFTWSWIVELRMTWLRYLLGQGFLWSDLVCYGVGCSLAFVINARLRTRFVKEKRHTPPIDHDQ